MSRITLSLLPPAIFVAFVTAQAICALDRPTVANWDFQESIDPDGKNWHQWRGPEFNGVSRTANPPLQWSENKNIKWKVAIEGQGSSTPIVWDNKIFLLTAVNTGKVDPDLPKPEDQPKRIFGIKHPNTFYDFKVICLDRETGKELWKQTVTTRVPHEGVHGDNDFASASPTTDGERLYCWFGSAGLYCFDLDGKALWERDLGAVKMGASLGEGCSPVIHGNRLILVRDHRQQSSIEVLNKQTGETIWKKNRDEPNGWATPIVVEHSGKTQVITSGDKFVRSYNLDDGSIIWQCSGLSENAIPCPVIQDDHVICMTGYNGFSLLSIPLAAKGDITGTDQIAWSMNRSTPYIPSPVLYEGWLYFNQSNNNILSCVDAKSGKPIIERTRLEGIRQIYASPIAAAGHVFISGRNGNTVVIKRSENFEVVATNQLEEEIDASPAVAGNEVFIRGEKSLYCIAETH